MGDQSSQRWLWLAVDHHTNTGLAYVFGRRKNVVFKALKALLDPLGIGRYYTDGWGAYTRHLDVEKHEISKRTPKKSNGKT